MAKKNNNVNEIIPDGMSKKSYADKAFRKKVTLVYGCILLAFLIAVGSFIGVAWYKTNEANKRFEAIEAAYIAERDSVLARLKEIEAGGGSHEDKAAVKIELTDENFSYWISDLDASYQVGAEGETYAQFAGAQIHLQGMFITREYSAQTQYWVYRLHAHDGDEHDHEAESEEPNIAEMIPIEVIFADDIEIPEDGVWVDVVGVIGPDSTRSLSAVRDAVITIMDEPGTEHVE